MPNSTHSFDVLSMGSEQGPIIERGLEKDTTKGSIPGVSPTRTPHANDSGPLSAKTTIEPSSPAEERGTPSPFHTPKSRLDFPIDLRMEGNKDAELSKNDSVGRTSAVPEREQSPPQTPRSRSAFPKEENEKRHLDGNCEDVKGLSGTINRSQDDLEKKDLEAHALSEETEWKRPISDRTWYLVLLGLMLGAVLYGLDTTIAADVQGPILQSLGDIEKLAWVGIGFAMGSVAVILLVGQSYGLFEIKYLLIGFLTLFSAGSAICGAAPSMNTLIIGRVVAGIGGAGTYLGGLTYVSKFASPKEQPLYNGLIGLCWGGGTILGPIVGGGFSESSATWRWSFYINLPLTAAVAPIFFFLFPKHNPMPNVSGWNKFKSIDWIGAFLNAAVFILFQVVLTFAGSKYAWNSTTNIVLWSVFGAAFFAYVIQQGFCLFTTRERQLFPVQFLGSRTLVLLFTGTAASTTALAVAIFYTPIFFQFTRGDSAIKAAIRLLPLICLYVFSLILSSASLPTIGRYQPLYIFSGVLLIVGGAMMHTVKITTAAGNIYGYEILVAIGAGMINQTGYSVGAAKVKSHEVPAVLGFMNVAQIGTAAIALSIADGLYQNLGFIGVRDAVSGYGLTSEEIRSALAGAQSSVLSAGNPAVVGLVVTAIAAVIAKIWLMVVAAGGVSLLSGILMRREKLQLGLVAGG